MFWENQMSISRIINLVLYLSPYTKTNSQWTKNINASPETMEQLEEYVGSTLYDTGMRKDFLNRTPIV